MTEGVPDMTGRAGDGVRHQATPGVPALPASAPTTPLDSLACSLRARAPVPGGQVALAAILWTDPRHSSSPDFSQGGGCGCGMKD